MAQCLQYNGGPYCWVNNGQAYYNNPVGCAGKGAALPASCFPGATATSIPTPTSSQSVSSTPAPTPVSSSCPDITCSVTTDSSGYKAGVPVTNGGGAGGTCTYGDPIQGKNSNIGQCTSFKCPNQPDGVLGHTVSVCQINNCYANSCECWPDSACP